MLDRQAQRGRPAERVPQHVDRLADQRRDVIGHHFGAERPAGVGRAPVTRQVDGDHSPAGGQRGQRREQLARPETAVQEYERLARTVFGGAKAYFHSSAMMAAAGLTSLTAPADRPA